MHSNFCCILIEACIYSTILLFIHCIRLFLQWLFVDQLKADCLFLSLSFSVLTVPVRPQSADLINVGIRLTILISMFIPSCC